MSTRVIANHLCCTVAFSVPRRAAGQARQDQAPAHRDRAPADAAPGSGGPGREAAALDRARALDLVSYQSTLAPGGPRIQATWLGPRASIKVVFANPKIQRDISPVPTLK